MKKISLSLFILFISAFTFSALNQVEAQSVPTTAKELSISDQYLYTNLNELDHFINVVVFIRFADETDYVSPYDYSYYNNIYNSDVTASLEDYYLEVSYGQLDIETIFATSDATILYFTDSFSRGYYEPYDATTNPDGYTTNSQEVEREHSLLKSAIDWVDANSLIDSSINLDANNDGEVDSISFFVAGEDTGWNSLLWPHRWVLTSYYNYSAGDFTADAPTINGSYVYDYTFQLMGDTTGYSYGPQLGVIAHEMFHVLTAPDLYHYNDYDWINAIGSWGLMSDVGTIPNHMLGYMKYMYGNWIDEIPEITSSGSYTLFPMSESGSNIYMINTGYSNEYVYLEYRDETSGYDSQLGSSGLLVYRVDEDYYGLGNVYGYYDSSGDPADEVFVFRPGLLDTTPPITFDDHDTQGLDEDGQIESAALSDFNAYSEMGIGTDIPMFYSDGSLMNIKIYNVVEHDSYITFDVYMEPQIELSNSEILGTSDADLVNLPGLSYTASITNIPTTGTVYYTTDGNPADETSNVYDGSLITLTPESHIINWAYYEDGVLVADGSKEYTFVNSLESSHNPYGNYENLNFFLSFSQVTEFDLIFSGETYLEDDYDFLTIFDGVTSTSYTGSELAGVTLTFSSAALLINFNSDESVDDFYGFLADLEVFDYSFSLIGDQTITLNPGETYIDEGYNFEAAIPTDYYVQVFDNYNAEDPLSYVITYELYSVDSGLLVTLVRYVNYIDYEPPVITLRGDETVYLELGQVFIDPGAEVTDNVDETRVISADSYSINFTVVGTYTIYYNATDSSGNDAVTVSRTIVIQDTTAPTVELNPSVDTIQVGTEYVDESIDYHDLAIVTVTQSGTVDNSTVGTYLITYTATDASGNATSIDRYVTVYAMPDEVYFTLGDAVTTIIKGQAYVDGTCVVTINGEDNNCDPSDNTVDVQKAGIYTITYAVTVGDKTYSTIRYVFVLDTYDDVLLLRAIYKPEEGDLL